MQMSFNRAEKSIKCKQKFGNIRLRIPPVADFGKYDIIRFTV